MIEFKTGDIFKTDKPVIVNTINCVGVMGKGLAKQFAERADRSYLADYKKRCKNNQISPGKVYFFQTKIDNNDKLIASFSTKNHWRNPSKYEWIESGLDDFITIIENEYPISDDLIKSMESMDMIKKGIAFPMLGCENGKLDEDKVLSIMQNKLGSLCIPIEIWRFHE